MSLKKLCLEGNKWVSLGTVGAAIKGLYDSHPTWSPEYIPEFAFFTFLILFRVKLYVDDEIFFLSLAKYETVNFRIGMLFALVSWVFITLSALAISTIANNNSYFYCLLSIMVSTLWIVAEAFHSGAYREQNIWVGTNAIYMGILAYLIWLEPTKSAVYDWSGLGMLLVVLAVDYKISHSLQKLHGLEIVGGK